MTVTGHKGLTDAIVANIRRQASQHTREVVRERETLSEEARVRLIELQREVDHLGQVVRALQDRLDQAPHRDDIGFRDDGSLPAFLGGRPVQPDAGHALNNLRAEIDALTEMVRRLAEPAPAPPIDPRIAAIEAVREAAESRRRLAMPGGNSILAVKLTEVAHLARAGQEGPITLMAALAEAQGNGAWQEAAADVVVQADSLARICVRTWAVEMHAIDQIERADAGLIETIRDGAIAALAAIQG